MFGKFSLMQIFFLQWRRNRCRCRVCWSFSLYLGTLGPAMLISFTRQFGFYVKSLMFRVTLWNAVFCCVFLSFFFHSSSLVVVLPLVLLPVWGIPSLIMTHCLIYLI